MKKNITVSNKTVWFTLAAILLLYAISFINRYVNDDEGMIAEWAYWLIKKGYACSSLTEPLGTGFEIRNTVYHKLMAFMAIPLIKIFGMELYPLKSLSFVFFLLTIYVASIYFKTNNLKKHKLLFLLFTIFYALNSKVFEFAYTFRPEIVLSFFGFSSFFVLKNCTNNNKPKLAALAGFFAGMAFLAHLNGISYLLAGFFLLLIYKNYKALGWFTIAGFFTTLLYFADMLDTNIIESLKHDLFNSPDVKSNNFTFYLPFIKLINEQQRFLHSPVEISTTILLVFSVIFSKKGFIKQQKLIFTYLLLLIVFLGSLSSGKTPKYLMVYMPFIITIIVLALANVNKLNNIKKYALAFFILFYFTTQSVFIVQIFNKRYNLKQVNSQILSQIPPSSSILSHSNLVFGGIENYKIHSFLSYYWAKKTDEPDTFENFMTFAYNCNEDYVAATKYFFNKKWIEQMQFETLKTGDTVSNYSVTFKNNEIAIFKLNKKLN